MTNQPEPIRKSSLPTTPPPEWEFFTFFPYPDDDGGDMVRGQRQRGVQVRRLVTYGDWEPVRPDRWADEPEPAAVSAAVAPPTQAAPSLRAGLRDEIVKALGRITTVPPVAHRREQADHVLAVLYREWPWLRAEAEDAEPTDRAAVLREAADRAEVVALRLRLKHDTGAANGAYEVMDELRRMADETATETPEDPARIDRLRPEFTEHASVEAIDAQLDRARRQERRWHIRAEWLIGLRQARADEPAAGARQDGDQS